MKKIEVSEVKRIIGIVKKQRNYFVSPYLDQETLIDEEVIRTKIFNYEWIVYEDMQNECLIVFDNPKKPLLINYSEILYIGELDIFLSKFNEYISFLEEKLSKVYKKDSLIFIEDIIYNNELAEKFKGQSYKRSAVLKNEFNGTKDIEVYHKGLEVGDCNGIYR